MTALLRHYNGQIQNSSRGAWGSEIISSEKGEKSYGPPIKIFIKLSPRSWALIAHIFGMQGNRHILRLHSVASELALGLNQLLPDCPGYRSADIYELCIDVS